MTTGTLTLTDFLLARIAEDEAVARALVERDVFAPTQGPDMARVHEDDEYAALNIGAGRVLAECVAKRHIIEDAAGCADDIDHGVHGEWIGLQSALRHLAAVYADHPDYRDDWSR